MHSGVRLRLVLAVAPVLLAAPVTVSVVDARGVAVENAYVAIVAADSPWRAPVAETTTAPVRFDVAPGTYRLVVGAPGFATEWRDSVIVGSEGASFRVPLQPLAWVAGRVVDREGRAVANARVASYFDRIPDHPQQLSGTGERALRSNLLAGTDDDGFFQLPIAPSRPAVVLIEADGMAPVVVDDVTAGSDRLSQVVLDRGASLALRLPRTDGVDPRIELLPVRTSLAASLPAHRAIRLWRRRAADPVWTSLPAGTYDVALRAGDSAEPVVLGRVTLGEGEQRSLPLPLPRDAHAGAMMRIMIGGTAPPLKITRWRGGTAQPVVGSQRASGDATEIAIENCEAGDLLVLTGADRVGSVRVTNCGGPHPAALHDRAELQLQLDSGIDGGLVVAASCDDGRTRMEVPFAAKERSVSLPFPAGCSAVAIHPRGLRRVDAGTVRVSAGQQYALRVRNPGRAASLLVRVRNGEGARIAVVTPDEIRDVRSLDALARAPRLAEGTADAKGWVSFHDLGPEPVQLLAFSSQGRVAALSSAFRLTAGDERIEQMDLEPPGVVHVEVRRDSGAEGVLINAVVLGPAGGSPWPRLLELQAPPVEDRAVFDSVPAGTWLARTQARVRGGNLQHVGRGEIQVQPGTTTTATLSFSGFVYRGKVIGGRNPVADGVLYLERVGEGNKGNQAAAIDDGRFTVLLEEPGTFRVAIQRRDGSRVAVPAPVVFESPSKEVTVRLGGARVAGTVAGPDGRPVPDARIYARGPNGADAQTSSNESGAFTLDDLPAGPWTLRAQRPQEQSDDVTVDVSPGRDAGGVQLVVRAAHVIRGKVALANGTPAVHAALLVGEVEAREVPITALTNERGEFELRHNVPLEGKPANVYVRLGDGAAFTRRLPLHDGMTLTAPQTGTVILHRRDAPWRRDTTSNHILVAEDGAWLHPLNAGRIEAGRLVAALAPGVWRYVVLAGDEHRRLLRSGAGVSLPALHIFVVNPATVAEVELVFDNPKQEGR